MAQSLIDKIRKLPNYEWGKNDCVSMLQMVYEHKSFLPHGVVNFRLKWMEQAHARVIVAAGRRYGGLCEAYINCLQDLDFVEVGSNSAPCAFVTKDIGILYLENFEDSTKTYRFDLSEWHGALLGVCIKHENKLLHFTYHLDGIYIIKNIFSVYKYFDHRSFV